MEEMIYQTVNGIKIFPIDYLMHAELSDSDINSLLNKDGKGFLYSFIVGMFRHVGIQKKSNQIINIICNESGWQDNYYWSAKQRKDYEQKITEAYKNIYQYGDELSKSYAEWFSIVYGFTVK